MFWGLRRLESRKELHGGLLRQAFEVEEASMPSKHEVEGMRNVMEVERKQMAGWLLLWSRLRFSQFGF